MNINMYNRVLSAVEDVLNLTQEICYGISQPILKLSIFGSLRIGKINPRKCGGFIFYT